MGTPVALVLAFWYHYDFQGLWLGLLAAQAACVVRMLLVIGRTDWAAEAKRAQQLAGAGGALEIKDGMEVGAAGGDDDPGMPIVVVIERPKDQC